MRRPKGGEYEHISPSYPLILSLSSSLLPFLLFSHPIILSFSFLSSLFASFQFYIKLFSFLINMKPILSEPWWQKPPFISTEEELRYRRRCRGHDYQRSRQKYMITIAASRLLPPLSLISEDLTRGQRVELTPFGDCLERALEEWLKKYRWDVKYVCHALMPDHLHLCFAVSNRRLIKKFSSIIADLMGKATVNLQSMLVDNQELHCQLINHALERLKKYNEAEWRNVLLKGENYIPVEEIRYFQKGFTDSISLNKERWETLKAYVLDNPRRLLFKRKFRSYFRDRWEIRFAGRRAVCVGNILLLKKSWLQTVRFSSKYNEEQVRKNEMLWDECMRSGGALVSPFIHPKERAAYKRAIAGGGNVIRICDNGFPERFSPSREEFELMAEGRLLLISAQPYRMGKREMTRASAEDMNNLAKIISDFAWYDQSASLRRLPT